MPPAPHIARLAADSTVDASGLRRRASDAKAARTGWDAPGIGTANGPQNAEKWLRKANPNLTPRFPNEPRTQANMASRLDRVPFQP